MDVSDQHQNSTPEERPATPHSAPPAQPRPTNAPRGKQRLDLLLVERGLAESREQARRLIMAGEVLVDEQVSDKPGHSVPLNATLRVRTPLPYVSRGGQKLAAALQAFAIDVTGRIAIDVGASTGGFTDCLLQHGAGRVYAIDVGYGQLAWKLRSDPRVVILERTNIRHLAQLPEAVLADLAVIDASFISLTLVLPAALRLLTAEAQVVALIKPQFEAGQEAVGKGGVVRDAKTHQRVLQETFALAASLGLTAAGLIASPLLGPAGNVEFLIWLHRAQGVVPEPEQLITSALEQARLLRQKSP
ncbi:MAG: TlyA family RNA methyltransferase [Caldilineaceae bacterium]|nr:TlyA family RNA methyltransferase [Caldilineaceae bacterium]